MKLNEIQDLIKFVSRSGVSEVEVTDKDFKIVIKTDTPGGKKGKGKQGNQEQQVVHAQVPQQMQMQPMQQQMQQPAQQQPAAPKEEKENSSYIEVKSPMIGTFYRSSSPDKPPFVNVGDSIKEGQTICIIEAMKLFNEIEAEISGKVIKVLIDDASPVEYDQPLFLIDPS